MTSADALDRFLEIADERAARGDPWLAACLMRLQTRGGGLESFGLSSGWRAAAHERRSKKIRTIASRFPDISARAMFDVIARRPDLQREIGAPVTFDIVRRALAHLPRGNAPALKAPSRHGTRTTKTAADG